MTPQIDWLHKAPDNAKDKLFAVPAGIRMLIGVRPDLSHLKVEDLLDRIGVYAWWESDSRSDYPEMEWLLQSAELDALRDLRASELFAHPGSYFTRMMRGNWPSVLDLIPDFTDMTRNVVVDENAFTVELPKPLQLIWADRPDLLTSHDITTTSGRISFLVWWFNFGHKEYIRVTWRVDPALRHLKPIGPQGENTLPHFLSLIVQGRDDLSSLYPLETESGWLAALCWWEQFGFREFSVPSWALRNHFELRRKLFEKIKAFESTRDPNFPQNGPTIPYLAHQIWSARADLKTAFDIRTAAGRRDLNSWWAGNGQNEYTDVAKLFEDAEAKVPGINIVGYSQAVIGIAEDVRMAARSAQTAGIPYCVINAPMPGPERLDHTLDAQTVLTPEHPVSVYCLPPTELIRLGLEGGRSLLSVGTYNIGAWHWELPVWPAHLLGVGQMVDEIWVFSEYVKGAFLNMENVVLRKMPLAVELPSITGPNRSAFGLSLNKFLFLVMFDGNSWLSRKNPLGAVRAFKAAFPTDQSVGLVIKAMGLGRGSAAWQEILNEIAGDERVIVVNKTLTRIEVTSLMASCDAYISLHRSEGFGRIIAEAMLLGIPTVVTSFSGNVDFCSSETSYLVDGELIPVEANEYIFSEGQFWCDPDLSRASAQMIRLRADSSDRRRISQNALKNITENYSIQAVAESYKTRLQQLKQENRI